MPRKKKIESPKKMEELWEDYKKFCDNKTVTTHDFSSKEAIFVTADLKRSVTYTIDGFCVWFKIARQSFYNTYDKDKRYADIVTRMKEESAQDIREKFELGIISERLSGLWLSKHGYKLPAQEKDEDIAEIKEQLRNISESLKSSYE